MKNEFHKFPLILKSLDEDGIFCGYASVYNVQDNHNDIILNGAFEACLKGGRKAADIKLLWQHNVSEPIGIFTKIVEDEIGLYVEGKLLLDVSRAGEAYSLMQAGALDGLSIGFTIKDFDINADTGTRIIFEAELWEISLVTFPANEEARVTSVAKASKKSRPKETIQKEINDLERLHGSISMAISRLK